MLQVQAALAFDLYSAGDLSWARLEGSLDLVNYRVTVLREVRSKSSLDVERRQKLVDAVDCDGD